MATNGESAKQWLADNSGKVSIERMQQIIASIHKKLDAMNSSHSEYNGFLEALDVMDQHLLSLQGNSIHTIKNQEKILDFSPLIPDKEIADAISPEEKTRRFRELLKTSDL